MICIDANVVLEVVEKRSRAMVCQEFMEVNSDEKAISMLALDQVMYFVEKDKLPWASVKKYLDTFVWLPLTQDDAAWAFAHWNGKDFEDALQVACALREGCKRFVTLDQKLAAKYGTHIAVDYLH